MRRLVVRDTRSGLRLLTPPGVFQPISDTWLLARAARPLAPGARVLDLCTGSGAVAIALARDADAETDAGDTAHRGAAEADAVDPARRRAAEVVAVDLSRRATWTARVNARLNRARVDVRRGDLLDAVAGEAFDLIVSNPPYVPSPDGEVPTRGLRRAWDAGADGRALLDRILDQAPAALSPGGTLMVVHSSVCGEARTLERMAAAGLEAGVVASRRGPLGPLMRGRAGTLEARGLLAPGVREEDVVVIGGRRPRDQASVEAGGLAVPV